MRHTCFQFPTNVLEQKEKKQFVLSRVFPFRFFFFWISSFENFPYQQFFWEVSLPGAFFRSLFFQELFFERCVVSGVLILGICHFCSLFFRFYSFWDCPFRNLSFQEFILSVFSVVFSASFFFIWGLVLLVVCSFTVLIFTYFSFHSFVLLVVCSFIVLFFTSLFFTRVCSFGVFTYSIRMFLIHTQHCREFSYFKYKFSSLKENFLNST